MVKNKRRNLIGEKRGYRVLRGIGVAIFWVAVWWILAAIIHKELLLPDPVSVAIRFGELVVTWPFWQVTLSSLFRVVAGFALGMVFGILLAVLMYKSRMAFALFSPLIKVVRATPVASFIILALVWISGGRLPIFISFLMVLPVAWSNAYTGLKNTDPQLLQMASVFNVSPWAICRNIYVPSLHPYLVAAATTGLGLAWKSGITAEVIASPSFAIGSKLQNAKVALETVDVFVWTVVVVALSMLLEMLLLRAVKGGKNERCDK